MNGWNNEENFKKKSKKQGKVGVHNILKSLGFLLIFEKYD